MNPHPTALVANALNQFDFRFKPLRPGSKDIYVHIVDVEFHLLLSAWLIAAKADQQAYTKQYNVKLKVGKTTVKVSKNHITAYFRIWDTLILSQRREL